MTAAAGAGLPRCLRGFPGAILHVSAAGVVLDSNGRLEAALGRPLVGRPFRDAVDADSSGAKWDRLLAAPPPEGAVWELVLAPAGGGDTLVDPRAFSVMPDESGERMWLVEHPRDARLDYLREQVTGVNSELAATQRELVKERRRLARALAELGTRNAQLEATTAELERSNAALDEFAHAVSHDLKAPLRNVANYATWAAEDAGAALPAASRAHLERLGANVRRMRAMIEGVLRYARAGRDEGAPEAVDVGALLRDVLALLDPPPAVVVTADDDLPTLRTPRAPLQQVFQNLVDNAIKYARRADARVHVGGRAAGDGYEFSVADNGPGIPPAARDGIWLLFRTLDSSDGVERTGIGLAVVRRLVEAHGGRIWVEDTPGGGATFRFLWAAPAADTR